VIQTDNLRHLLCLLAVGATVALRADVLLMTVAAVGVVLGADRCVRVAIGVLCYF